MIEAGVAAAVLLLVLTVVLPRFRESQISRRASERHAELQAVVDALMAYEVGQDYGYFHAAVQPIAFVFSGNMEEASASVELPSTDFARAWSDAWLGRPGLPEKWKRRINLNGDLGTVRFFRSIAASAKDYESTSFDVVWALAAPVPGRDDGDSFDYKFPKGAGNRARFHALLDDAFQASNGLSSAGVIMAWAAEHVVANASGKVQQSGD